MFFLFRLNHIPEKEVFNFDEKPVVMPAVVNGTDCVRSRSPSPELDLSNDSNYLPRSVDGFSSSASTDTGNSIFNANYLMSDDKQISQILKEANSIHSVHQNNIQENKVKVRVNSLVHKKANRMQIFSFN